MSTLRCMQSPCIPRDLEHCRYWSVFTGLLILIACIVLGGCTSNPKPALQYSTKKNANIKEEVFTTPGVPAHPVIQIAHGLKGKPYRYGGVTPQGFDCSGFVHYAYQQVGIQIPRTTQDQYRLSQRLRIEQARPGDLLFFSIASPKLSHVGLYTGDGQFIHASTSKKRVAEASLHDPYWWKRLIGVGRIH